MLVSARDFCCIRFVAAFRPPGVESQLSLPPPTTPTMFAKKFRRYPTSKLVPLICRSAPALTAFHVYVFPLAVRCFGRDTLPPSRKQLHCLKKPAVKMVEFMVKNPETYGIWKGYTRVGAGCLVVAVSGFAGFAGVMVDSSVAAAGFICFFVALLFRFILQLRDVRRASTLRFP